MQPDLNKAKAGFTLIELSIVLVIIGLIVGGVLVGRDLIQAAQIRATIQQKEAFNTAINTFRVKYNYLPGDVPADKAAGFGMQARAGTPAHGDGNGYYESCTSAGDVESMYTAGCETVLFWRDLSYANLIAGSFNTATDGLAANITSAQLPLYFPAAKLGNNNIFIVFNGVDTNIPPTNYLGIASMDDTDTDGLYEAANFAMTPPVARTIDTKIDDGMPFTGRVLMRNATNSFAFYTVLTFNGDSSCLNFQTGRTPVQIYSSLASNAGRRSCNLMFAID